MVDFAGLDNSLINDTLIKGFKEKSTAEFVADKFWKNEKQLEEQALRDEFSVEANRKKDEYKDRINNLFADFDKHLPADFNQFSNQKLKDELNTTKDNIRLLADDMHELSKQAGGNPKLEQQAEKITANLLDRLKNDLGLTPEERKKLEGKSLEEIQEYYSQTRSDKLDKLNQTVGGYRQELEELNKSSEGKSPEEKAKLYEAKLKEMELKTGQNKDNEKGVEISMAGIKHENVTINDVKTPVMTSQSISDVELRKNKEKTKIEIAI